MDDNELPKRLIKSKDLPSLGIDFTRTTLLRQEYLGRFPRRIRLSASKVAYDLQEVLRWIEARKAARKNEQYADPF